MKFYFFAVALLLIIAACSQKQEVISMNELKISSPAFENNAPVPETYSCDGENINPPIHIEGIPEGAKSLALLVEDPDAPSGTFAHWVVWNIPVTNLIEEDSVPGIEGANDFGNSLYGGPCPPKGNAHRYVFIVYALDAELSLDPEAKKQDVMAAMKGHILARGELTGIYKRG